MTKISKILFVFSIISIIAFVIAKSLLGSWMPFYTILLAFAVGFAGIGFWLERIKIVQFFTMKTTKHGMNMGAMVILVFALVVITNYIAVKRNKVWDFSQSQTNTLSDQSIKIVKNLKDTLKVLFFYKEGTQGVDDNRKAFRDLLKKYQDQSSQIQLEFVELNQNPKLAEEYGVNKGTGLAFVEYQGKRNRLEKVEEQEITQAIIKVTRDKKKLVYFITGHGEADSEDSQEASGLNAFKLLIENNSFEVKTLNLPAQPKIPDDADTVVIVGPRQAMTDFEVKALEEYLVRGGNLLLALEPNKTVGLEKILSTLGIKVEVNFIKSSYLNMGYIEGGTLGNVFSLNSGITKVFVNERDVVRFDWPSNLSIEKKIEGLQIEAVVRTDQNATAFPLPKVEEGNYPRGPFQLGLEIKGKYPTGGQKEFQMVVYGDAEFLTNHLLYQNLNRDLALNSISQLTKEEGLISIAPREIKRTELEVTTAKMGAFYLMLFLVPVGLLAVSLTLWFRRRGASES